MDISDAVLAWLSTHAPATQWRRQSVVVPSNATPCHVVVKVAKAYGDAATDVIINDEADHSVALHQAVMGLPASHYEAIVGLPASYSIDRRLAEHDSRQAIARAQREFARPYIGDTLVARLEVFIRVCREACTDYSKRWAYPYTTIVQSSGFGKSRLTKQLAARTKDNPNASLKVLYLCVREETRCTPSSGRIGYPLATPHLASCGPTL